MRVIKASATIMDREDKMNHLDRIAECAAVCYQRESKAGTEKANSLIKGIIEKEHNSVLEMAAITLRFSFYHDGMLIGFLSEQHKYLTISKATDDHLYVTGTVRAWRDFLREKPNSYIKIAANIALSKISPILFPPTAAKEPFEVMARIAPLSEVDGWQAQEWYKTIFPLHRFVGVRFFVSRAISHQIVRHRPCSFLQESTRYCRYTEDVVFVDPEFDEGQGALREIWKSACLQAEEHYHQMLAGGARPEQARGVLGQDLKTELIVYAPISQWWHMFKLRCEGGADQAIKRVMRPPREEFKKRGWV